MSIKISKSRVVNLRNGPIAQEKVKRLLMETEKRGYGG